MEKNINIRLIEIYLIKVYIICKWILFSKTRMMWLTMECLEKSFVEKNIAVEPLDEWEADQILTCIHSMRWYCEQLSVIVESSREKFSEIGCRGEKKDGLSSRERTLWDGLFMASVVQVEDWWNCLWRQVEECAVFNQKDLFGFTTMFTLKMQWIN